MSLLAALLMAAASARVESVSLTTVDSRLAVRVVLTGTPGLVAVHPDREDLVHERGGGRAPARGQVRLQLLEEVGRVGAHADVQAVRVEARPRAPAQPVDAPEPRSSRPQARHHDRHAPHDRAPLLRRPECSRRHHQSPPHDACRGRG